MDIPVKYFDDDLPRLKHIGGQEKSTWIDVRASRVEVNGEERAWFGENGIIRYKRGDIVRVFLGFGMKLPEGYEAHVAPRGSTLENFGILQANSVGVIDEAYNGEEDEWFIPFYCVQDSTIHKYDRIGQFRVMEKMQGFNFTPVNNLEEESRGGYGTTGTK